MVVAAAAECRRRWCANKTVGVQTKLKKKYIKRIFFITIEKEKQQ